MLKASDSSRASNQNNSQFKNFNQYAHAMRGKNQADQQQLFGNKIQNIIDISQAGKGLEKKLD